MKLGSISAYVLKAARSQYVTECPCAVGRASLDKHTIRIVLAQLEAAKEVRAMRIVERMIAEAENG
jgi:hypothetical protein